MKKCSKCGLIKDEKFFSLNKSKSCGYSSECKDCHKVIRKAYYERNKAKEMDRTKQNKLRVKEMFNEYKSKLSCILCGESHVSTLQFHHRNPKEKDFNISTAVANSMSFDSIMDEVSKCVVLCSNCHFKEHYELRENNVSLL